MQSIHGGIERKIKEKKILKRCVFKSNWHTRRVQRGLRSRLRPTASAYTSRHDRSRSRRQHYGMSNGLLIQLVTSLVLYQSQLSCYLLDRVRCEVQFSLGLCFCAKVTRPLNNSVAMELSLNFQGFMSACWRRFNLNFRSTSATFSAR